MEYIVPFVVQNPWCSTLIVIGAAGVTTLVALFSPSLSSSKMTKMITDTEKQSDDVPVSVTFDSKLQVTND